MPMKKVGEQMSDGEQEEWERINKEVRERRDKL